MLSTFYVCQQFLGFIALFFYLPFSSVSNKLVNCFQINVRNKIPKPNPQIVEIAEENKRTRVYIYFYEGNKLKKS